MLYFDHWKRVVSEKPDKAAFVADGAAITYAEVDTEAAKVYRYLKENEIGAEQIVMILMPKGLHFFSCMLGVWRAGAAFVLVQDTYPKERIDFIRKDTSCALVLDQGLFDKIIQNTKPLASYEETEPHRLAYVVYTSGSTGTPKGILHEYGNIERCVSSVPAREERADIPEEKPLTGPLSFVHTLLNLVYNTMDGITTLLEPEEKLRDFNYFKNFILEKKLTSFYLPPSYIRLYKDPSPYLKEIGTGSEPANGLYYPRGVPAIKNTYSCSEAGFAVMSCILDKAYDVAPIGRPLPGVEAVLMDEDDKIIEGEGTGELCIKNDFFRGYLNQPELTERAKRGGYFHTADVCRRDADGLYYIVGRADDMIKINGNRIEPAEIEAAVKELTGLDEVMAKGFVEEERSYVAVYYIRKNAEELGILEGKSLIVDEDALRERLPQYMIPSVYVPLDEFPMTASGKKSRKELKAPDLNALLNEYVAPDGEMETYLCRKMAEVLGRERCGAEDDFLLFGDSMKCIELVSICEEIELSAKLIYRYKTPRKLAAVVKKKRSAEELAKENRAAMEKDFPLLPGQIQNLIYQKSAPESGFLNIPLIRKMGEDVNPERLCCALNEVLLKHPGLHIRIFQDEKTGEYRQRYEASYFTPVTIERMSEADFQKRLPELKAVFAIENAKLYRAGVIVTEEAVYYYLVMHHLISDGGAVAVLRSEIYESYRAKAPDLYFSILNGMEKAKHTPQYEEAKRYFAERFDEKLKNGVPLGIRMDHVSDGRTLGRIIADGRLRKSDKRDVNFYMTAAALAEGWYNETDFAFLLPIYSDRDDPSRLNAAGYLVDTIVLGLDLGKEKTPRELLTQMRAQFEYAITNTEYNYLEDKIGDSSPMIRFNYQRKTEPDPVMEAFEERVTGEMPTVMSGVMSITFFEEEDEDAIQFSFNYASECYEKESMERYEELFFRAVDFLDPA